jgi:hypothetical protein
VDGKTGRSLILGRFWPFLACALLMSSQALADALEVEQESSRERAMQQVRAELETVEKRWYMISRVRWGYPLRWSAGIGGMLTEQPTDQDCSISCAVRGWHFEVEPAQYGIQGSLGWGKMIGSTGGTKRWMHTVYWGWAVRGVVVCQWGSDFGPLGVGPQTLMGIEGNLSIVRLNFTAGVLRSLSSVSSEEWVLTGSLGWGF